MPRARGALMLGALLALCAAPAASQNLQDSGLELPGVWAARAAWGDYDDDGDLDLALTGQTLDETGQTRRISRIFRNDSALLVEDVAQSDRLVGVYFGDAAWADYDNDGDLDLAIAGWDRDGDESLRLYVNGPGAQAPDRLLTLDLTQVDDLGSSNFRGVRYASLAWADYDNDGDLDLVVSGMEGNGTSLTRLYRNGNGVLELDVDNSEAVINVHNGDLAWADYDNDGDLDLALSGENVTTEGGIGPVTEFYRNDPVGTLGLEVGLDLGSDPVTHAPNRVKGGSLAWADYDQDGNLDLAVSGRDAGLNAVLNLFRNRPAGNLSDDASFSLSRFQRLDGQLDWVDYDNDGDPDLVVAGRTSLSQYRALVLENRDGAVTGISAESQVEGLAGGDALWGDYDGNGRVDLLVAGVDAEGRRRTVLYSNLGTPIANRPPDPPAVLNPAQVSSRRVVFSWSPGEDVESGSLTYNLRVGAEPGGDDVVSGRAVYGPGNAGLTPDFVLERFLPPDQYYWSVQAVDGAFSRSEFSQEELFSVEQFVSSDQRIRSLTRSAMSWGDADGDGDPDLAIMGTNRSGEAQTLVYVNQSGTLTLQTDAGLTALRNGDLAWGDYDSDGDLDLFVTGEVSPGNRNSFLYSTSASATSLSFEAALRFRPDVSRGAVAWGDVNNDGDLDLLLMGQSGEVAEGTQLSFTRVYVNDGTGSFDATRDDSLVGLSNGDAAWADYDGDGDLDLAVTGKSTAGVREFRLYRNDLPGLLTDSGAELPGMESSDLAWADYNQDGDPDLVAGGLGADGSVATVLYANDGDQLRALAEVSLPGIQGGDLAWGDVDNDQDVDLIVVGNDGRGPIFQIYENTIGQTAPDSDFEAISAEVLVPVDFSALALADVDGDGDLDLITSGRDASLAPRTAVNENLTAQQFNPNFRPDPPASLAAADSGNVVLLSWTAGSDDGAPPPVGLTYDLRVGTAPGSGDVLTGSGALAFGLLGHARSHRLAGLASGTYYWSVRTVDAGLARSAWSAASSFIVDTEPPELLSLRLGRSAAGIGQAVPLALEFGDAHAGVDTDLPPRVQAAVGDSTYDFDRLQFTGTSWLGELVVVESMPSGSVRLTVAGVQDGKGNSLAPFDSAAAFAIDTDRPAVQATAPASGADSVSAALDEITITFSELLDPALAEEPSSYAVRPGGLSLTAAYDEATATVTLDLADPLEPGVEYAVEVSAALTDLAGNRAANSTTWSFRTAVPALVAADPADGAAGVAAGGTVLRATFDSGIWRSVLDQDGAVTVRREGEVIDLAGQPVFDADAGVLSMALAEPFRAGSRYQVALTGLLGGPLRATSEGDYAWTFATAVPQLVSVTPDSDAVDVDAGILEATASFSFALDPGTVTIDNFSVLREGQAVTLRAGDPVDRGDGVYAVAPTGGWSPGSAYAVQIGPAVSGPLGPDQPLTWRFQTAVPGVSGSEPADGATDVGAGNSRVSVSFDSGIARDVLADGDAVQVQGDGVRLGLAGEPIYDVDAATLSFLLAEPMRAGTRYRVALSGLLGGPRRATTAGDYTLSFSTAVPQLASVTPDSGEVGVDVDLSEAQAAFTVPLDADAVTADNFGILREGQAVALRDGDPVVRSAGVYGLAPAGGWSAGTAYTVQIAPAVTGPLGVALPLTWQFQTAVPGVAATSPADGQAITSGPQRVQITFSSAVDEGRVNPATFRMTQGGQALALAADEFQYDAGTFTVSLPAVDLVAGTGYSVTVSSRLGGPRADWSDHTFSFRTEIPSVSATTPADGSQGVSTSDAIIGVEFDLPMARALASLFQVQARSIDAVLEQGDSAPFELLAITGFGTDEGGAAASFSPVGGLQPFTEYRVEIARAAFGDLAEEGYSFGFLTAARLTDAGDGGTVRSGDRAVELYFPPNALTGGSGEIAITPVDDAPAGKPVAAAQASLTRVGRAYRIDAGGASLRKPATLALRYTADELGDRDATRLGIFALEVGQWQRLGGTPDPAAGKVSTAVDELGTVAIFEDLAADVGSLAVRLVDCQPRAFSPGGASLRAETDISFELTAGADVTVRVYSASGRLERVVARDLPMARGRNTVSWDGRDEGDDIVASGLYVVVVSAGQAQGEKVVAVVR